MTKNNYNIDKNVPSLHKSFLESVVPKLQKDERIFALAIGGSFILNTMDEFSDLDLVIVIKPDFNEQVLNDRVQIAGSLGNLLESFRGEHVGEPRLLICLYGPPLLHVDLKFTSLDDVKERVENPAILWQRDGVNLENYFTNKVSFPKPDKKWLENRFWVWVHYITSKIGRGELFEAIEGIGFLRVNVLGPLLLEKNNLRPQGLRRIENINHPELEQLKQTIPRYSAESCSDALRQSISIYEQISDKDNCHNTNLINEVKKYLNDIEAQL